MNNNLSEDEIYLVKSETKKYIEEYRWLYDLQDPNVRTVIRCAVSRSVGLSAINILRYVTETINNFMNSSELYTYSIDVDIEETPKRLRIE